MQDYIQFAKKNGVTLLNEGACQFCGAKTKRGIHECIEIFNVGFQDVDFAKSENHIYRFYIVDAHTLQHSEIHGRWSNHFHLSRLHLIFKYKVRWTYKLSPLLSEHLNKYKLKHANEVLQSPPVNQRGDLTSASVLEQMGDESQLKNVIENWAREVYQVWANHHPVADKVAKLFLS